jgi:hypothetical protein
MLLFRYTLFISVISYSPRAWLIFFGNFYNWIIIKYKPGTAKLDLGFRFSSIECIKVFIRIQPHHIVPDPKRDRQKQLPSGFLLERNNSSILDPRKYYLPALEQHCLFYKLFANNKGLRQTIWNRLFSITKLTIAEPSPSSFFWQIMRCRNN